MTNTIKLAVINHDTHTLHLLCVDQTEIDKCGGEQEYLDSVFGDAYFSWDYVVEVEMDKE